ncbi:MAG: restriction endonuclease subunit R [Spirulina sp. SIO3F2]|nr:restriction endonuclease subunit R [Spirulina sp. SIO3F2]
MVQTLPAKALTLKDLREQFGLQWVQDPTFFSEWHGPFPELTSAERSLLDQTRAGFFDLLDYPPLLEDVVRMSVLDPLLFVGGFFLAPFQVRSEPTVTLQAEADGLLFQGKIDALILKEQLWVLIIEAKRATFSTEAGLPQLLTYMLVAPQTSTPLYGVITTGNEFVFVKLLRQAQQPCYRISKGLRLRDPGVNPLYEVLQIFRHLSQLAIASPQH